MSYARVTRTADGAGALLYAQGGSTGRGHANGKARNEIVTPVNMFPGQDYAAEMDRNWKRMSPRHKIQVIRVIQSFSKRELDPDDPNDVLKANLIGQKFVRRYYPDRQAVVYTQLDGAGGCLHNHVVICDASMVDGKGCAHEQYYAPNVAAWTEKITSWYTTVDHGSKPRDKTTQTERGRRLKGTYSWKDDVKARIRLAMETAGSEEDFFARLEVSGLTAERTMSRKYGPGYTYTLDTFQVPEGEKQPKSGLRLRSRTLGTDYGVERLMELLERRRQKEKTEPRAEKKPTVAPPRPSHAEVRPVVVPVPVCHQQEVRDIGQEDAAADLRNEDLLQETEAELVAREEADPAAVDVQLTEKGEKPALNEQDKGQDHRAAAAVTPAPADRRTPDKVGDGHRRRRLPDISGVKAAVPDDGRQFV